LRIYWYANLEGVKLNLKLMHVNLFLFIFLLIL